MFNAVEAFKRQFTPVEGGYVYYPSVWHGGKLVTAEEYERLLANWKGIAGTRAIWKIAIFFVLASSVLVMLSELLSLPRWSEWLIMVAGAAGVCGWLCWVALAPYRLVKGRPDFAPPRSRSEARREARTMLGWPLVCSVVFFSGLAFVGSLLSSDRTASGWAWLVGSGLFFGAYSWIAFEKLRDRRRASSSPRNQR